MGEKQRAAPQRSFSGALLSPLRDCHPRSPRPQTVTLLPAPAARPLHARSALPKPRPDIWLGLRSPARELPGGAPPPAPGPPPRVQLPAPSPLAGKPRQTAGRACPRSRASPAKPGRQGWGVGVGAAVPAPLKQAVPGRPPAPDRVGAAHPPPGSRGPVRLPQPGIRVPGAPSLLPQDLRTHFGRSWLGSRSLSLVPECFPLTQVCSQPFSPRTGPVRRLLAASPPLLSGPPPPQPGRYPSGRSSLPAPRRPLRSYQLLFQAA